MGTERRTWLPGDTSWTLSDCGQGARATATVRGVGRMSGGHRSYFARLVVNAAKGMWAAKWCPADNVRPVVVSGTVSGGTLQSLQQAAEQSLHGKLADAVDSWVALHTGGPTN